ncbi:MAG: serine/threonine protein kinase [Proteobacteria bacterium]|nr:serine/threonine protein kinase [Pseudomonadota bacterium]
MPEGRTKVTKEVLCEESRFILANVMAEARYGRQNRYDDIRRVCEGAISIPFSEYVAFLDSAGYLRHDRGKESLEVTKDGEGIVNGGNLTELTERAVAHFKTRRRKEITDRERERERPTGERERERGSDRYKVTSSGGRGSVAVGGEIQSSAEIVDSRYEKLATIGTGGVGTVYRARQVPLNREVALKEIRELFGYFSDDQRQEIIRRFTEVVRAAAQLAHPNILPIHDVNLDREHPYLVGELAPNGSCRRLIKDAESIPVGLVLKYLLQGLHSLRAAHAERVYHRSLKPENLLIDGYGNVKVSDFGFSRIIERDAAAIQQVIVGTGNIAYMAPELYTDPNAVGPQTDIYAMGIIFYELLTRRLPGRRSPMPSQINDALPKGIDDIFDKMTRDSRSERYSTVDDILDDIDSLDGLSEVLDQQTQVLVAANPLDQVKFREGAAGDPVAGTDAEDPTPTPEDKSKPGYRPYSYQQRRKR